LLVGVAVVLALLEIMVVVEVLEGLGQEQDYL
jgi:hypothetical protein